MQKIEDWFSDEGREEIGRTLLRLAQKEGHETHHAGDILPGRPRAVANITDIGPWEIEELRIEYHGILNKLTYREAMALMRALGRSYSCFLSRRYGHRRPQLEEVIATIDWARNGKPIRLIKHKVPFASLLGGT